MLGLQKPHSLGYCLIYSFIVIVVVFPLTVLYFHYVYLNYIENYFLYCLDISAFL